MKEAMNLFEFVLYSGCLVMITTFILGLFQKYAPHVLPEILRGGICMNTTVILTYNDFGAPRNAYIEMNNTNRKEAKAVIKRTLNQEKFIDIGDLLIAVTEIKQISFEEVKGEL